MVHFKTIARRLDEVEGVAEYHVPSEDQTVRRKFSTDQITGAIKVHENNRTSRNETEGDTTTLTEKKRVEFIKNR